MQGPYRPAPQVPPPDPELARLAMEGNRRRMEVASGQEIAERTAGGLHLRTAIGAYRGSMIKRVVLGTLIGGVALGALGVALTMLGAPEVGVLLLPGFVVAFICIFLAAFIPPVASRGAVAAEQDWAMALPFQLFGYFDLLSVDPRPARRVVYAIVWQEGSLPPDTNLLHGIIGAVDPEARVDRVDARGATITGGAVSGGTGISVNQRPVYRNHRFCESIHGVVEQVLLPLHRTYPIALVTLSS